MITDSCRIVDGFVSVPSLRPEMSGMWKQWYGVVLLGVGLSLGAGCDRLGGGPGAEQREGRAVTRRIMAERRRKQQAAVRRAAQPRFGFGIPPHGGATQVMPPA